MLFPNQVFFDMCVSHQNLCIIVKIVLWNLTHSYVFVERESCEEKTLDYRAHTNLFLNTPIFSSLMHCFHVFVSTLINKLPLIAFSASLALTVWRSSLLGTLGCFCFKRAVQFADFLLRKYSDFFLYHNYIFTPGNIYTLSWRHTAMKFQQRSNSK